mmetsp:Transcript_39396/g.79558  ORF Transcript_39396/g.79558 Transcript_39396/m.79558 type:complete len:259 (-) Transcript_39396:166-942(-)
MLQQQRRQGERAPDAGPLHVQGAQLPNHLFAAGHANAASRGRGLQLETGAEPEPHVLLLWGGGGVGGGLPRRLEHRLHARSPHALLLPEQRLRDFDPKHRAVPGRRHRKPGVRLRHARHSRGRQRLGRRVRRHKRSAARGACGVEARAGGGHDVPGLAPLHLGRLDALPQRGRDQGRSHAGPHRARVQLLVPERVVGRGRRRGAARRGEEGRAQGARRGRTPREAGNSALVHRRVWRGATRAPGAAREGPVVSPRKVP